MRKKSVSIIANKSILSSVFLMLVFAGCACVSTPNPSVVDFVQHISEEELRQYSESLSAIGSRPGSNRPKTDLTIQLIEDELRDAGYQVISIDSNDSKKKTPHVNLIAEIRGVSHPERVVELGAHYDTVPFSPGADDNGSGVAGVLAVSRALATARCSNTIRFVFYCMEESTGAGSLTHVENILQNKNESLEGVIVLEAIGYAVDEPDTQHSPIRVPLILSPPRTGNFITVVGNSKSASIGNLYERSARRYVPDLKYYSLNRLGGLFKDAARSDHAAYWRSGLPGLMITDTALLRNPHYHQASDRIDTLNFPFMTQVVRATAAAVLEWAKLEDNAGEIRVNSNENRLTFYREYCQGPKRIRWLEDPKGISTDGLSREQACKKIVADYWNAAIDGNYELIKELWSSMPSGDFPTYPKKNLPQQIVEIGQPYDQENCFDGFVTRVVPSKVKFTNGQLYGLNFIVMLRDVGMEESCLIIGTWGKLKTIPN
ncbi:M20/M25/M40 family metallo-hydrolase [Candidatus Hydrogenedentota bacterium]